MIEINITRTCDRCNNIIQSSESMFKVKREIVPLRTQYPATEHNMTLFSDGINFNAFGDQHKAYHLCILCNKELVEFMEHKL